MTSTTNINPNQTRAQVAEAVAKSSTSFTDSTVQKLDALSVKRDAWEKGAFKKANDELYGLLAETLDIYLENEGFTSATSIKAHGQKFNTDLRKELTTRLKDMGVKVQSNSSTLTMLVRYVFKSDRKRAQGYAQVLSAAIQANVASAELPKYIHDAGGIEQIKRQMVLSEEAIEKRQQVQAASDAVRADLELNALKPLASVQLNSDGEYAVLLGKPNGSGFVDIIGVLPEVNEALINALMLRMAKQRVANGVTESVGQMLDAFAVPEAANDAEIAQQA